MEIKQRNLRIMVNVNAPYCTSGYGMQAAEFLPYFVKEGFPTACIAFYGLDGAVIEVKGFEGIKMYPKIQSAWGEDAMVEHAKNFKADIVMGLQDVWVLNTDALRGVKNYIPIVPIDHDPVPPTFVERLRTAYRIVTYSKFGYKELKRVGLHSTYIPHTVDTSVFKPLDRQKIRETIGIPQDAFVFGMVAANKDNPPRKSFQEVLDAFAMFYRKHKNAILYLHVHINQAGGFPIMEYAKNLGIDRAIKYTPAYDMMFNMGKEDMAQLYNVFDCLLMPSTSEGFGVPAIEAQACGKPAIVTDFTAMPELVKSGVTGEIVRVIHKRFDQLGSYIGIPDTGHLYQLMEKVFRADKKMIEEEATKWIRDNYDTKKVFYESWMPFLNKLENEIYPQFDKASDKK